MGRTATDKRERLVTAAIEQFHRHGYARTSLAQIANTAGVPAGNVFYYFKTKEDLALAVVDGWCGLLGGYLAALEPGREPWARLRAFVDQATLLSETYMTLGCPLAGLTRDLRQEGGNLGLAATRIYGVQLDWLKAQFQAAGKSASEARRYSRSLMARYNGSILLAFTQQDAGLIAQEVRGLQRWLREMR